MVNSEQVLLILNELIEQDVQYVVDIKISSSKIRRKVTVLVDTDAGIGIAECSHISRALAEQLEELIEEAYTLEVSSPGLDTPLKLKRQYLKNIGKTLRIVKENGEEIKGKLLKFNDLEIEIQPEKKKKEKIMPDSKRVVFEDIKEARVLVSFN